MTLKWCDVCVCCFLLQVIETLAASIEYGLEGLTKVEIILWLYIGKMIACDSGSDMYKVSLLHPPGFLHSLPSLIPPTPPSPHLPPPFLFSFTFLSSPLLPLGRAYFQKVLMTTTWFSYYHTVVRSVHARHYCSGHSLWICSGVLLIVLSNQTWCMKNSLS